MTRPRAAASSARRGLPPRRSWRVRRKPRSGVNKGAKVRRCTRQSSPSTSNSPSRMRGQVHAFARDPCGNWCVVDKNATDCRGIVTTAILPRMLGPATTGNSKCALVQVSIGFLRRARNVEIGRAARRGQRRRRTHQLDGKSVMTFISMVDNGAWKTGRATRIRQEVNKSANFGRLHGGCARACGPPAQDRIPTAYFRLPSSSGLGRRLSRRKQGSIP